MEMEDYFGELFDFNSILPVPADDEEIYSSSLQPCTAAESTKYPSPTTSSSANYYPISHLISFGNSENYSMNFSSSNLTKDDNYNISDQYYHHQDGCNIFNTSAQKSRTPAQGLDHVVAERKRRQELGQHFISLSKVVPGLTKLDKASLLEGAIEHLKALKERVNALEQEEVKSNDESKDDININGSSSKLSALEIKARTMNKSVLLKIFCKNEKGLISRIPCELEKMQLCVTDIKVMPFGDAALDITILLEMHSEFRGTVKDIVDHLEMVLLKPCDHLH